MTDAEEEFNKKYLDSLDLSNYLSQSNDVLTIIDLINSFYIGDNKGRILNLCFTVAAI